MKLTRYLTWLIVATAIFVTITMMVLVVVSRRQADTSKDELQTLLRVSSQIYALNALGGRLSASRRLPRRYARPLSRHVILRKRIS